MRHRDKDRHRDIERKRQTQGHREMERERERENFTMSGFHSRILHADLSKGKIIPICLKFIPP